MRRVTPTTATVSAVSAVIPVETSGGTRNSAIFEAPKAAEKKPATTEPTCSAARNRLGCEARAATRAPRAPRVPISSSWLGLSDTGAISVAEKTPDARIRSSTTPRYPSGPMAGT